MGPIKSIFLLEKALVLTIGVNGMLLYMVGTLIFSRIGHNILQTP